MKRLVYAVLVVLALTVIAVLGDDEKGVNNGPPVQLPLPCKKDAKALPHEVGTLSFVSGARAVVTTGGLRAVPNSQGASVQSAVTGVKLTTFSQGDKITFYNPSGLEVALTYGDCTVTLSPKGTFTAEGNGKVTLSVR